MSLHEIDIVIDDRTGEVFLTRDHTDLLDLANELDSGNHNIVTFFKDKPKNVDGEINYESFCG